MGMAVYNKLVRDKIPKYLESKGISYKIHTADDLEYWEKLKEKLVEEAIEFQNDETVGELADIWEVIEAIIKYKNFSQSEIFEAKKNKFDDRGGFDKRIILEES